MAEKRCGWNTGTGTRGPSRCGNPAKAHTDCPSTNNGLVCGIHARVVRSPRRWPPFVTYTLTPLTEAEKE